jgi:hypothetical protein
MAALPMSRHDVALDSSRRCRPVRRPSIVGSEFGTPGSDEDGEGPTDRGSSINK